MSTNYREQYAKYGRYFENIKKSYLTKPHVKISLELLMTLLAVSFFALFALRPTVNTITELLSNIKSQEEINAKLDEKIKNLSLAGAVWTQEDKRRFLVNQALPQEPQPDGYLRQIEGLSARNSVSLIALSVQGVLLFGKEIKVENTQQNKQNRQGANTLSVSFTVSGSYKSLLAFIDELENLRRIIKVESLSFGPGKGKNSDAILLTISGNIPYYKETDIK